jgi:hypothetical protein
MSFGDDGYRFTVLNDEADAACAESAVNGTARQTNAALISAGKTRAPACELPGLH